MQLQLHHVEPLSYANGPGCRCVIWVQGCHFRCPGCFNPQTHSFDGGFWLEVEFLADRIARLESRIEGITISGGEALIQLPALTELLQRVKILGSISVILFTGYTWEEIINQFRFPSESNPYGEHTMLNTKNDDVKPSSSIDSTLPGFLHYVDVLIAGRYDQRRHLAHGLCGSTNKTVHFITPRYSLGDLNAVPCSEIIIGTAGDVKITGIDAPSVKPKLKR
jgi:anaerobic ribonucleoside-triphosphate reductase activating protein